MTKQREKRVKERKHPRRERPDRKSANPMLQQRAQAKAWDEQVEETLQQPKFQRKELKVKIQQLDVRLGRAVRRKDSAVIQDLYDKRAEAQKALRALK